MNRGNRRRRQFHTWLSLCLLAFVLLMQISIQVQSARSLSEYLVDAIREETQETRQARITDDNHTDQGMIYFTKDMTRTHAGIQEEVGRFRELSLFFAGVMWVLLLQILTAFLRPKQRYIKTLEESSCHRRSEAVLVWFQHLWDGEKEARYNFGSIV